MTSLVSANGPSLTRIWPSRFCTVLASSGGRSWSPSKRIPRAITSSSHGKEPSSPAGSEAGSETASSLSTRVGSTQTSIMNFMSSPVVAARRASGHLHHHDERDSRKGQPGRSRHPHRDRSPRMRHMAPDRGPEIQGVPVTGSNWQDPPFNRWAYWHVSEILPTYTVSRGTGPARPLPPWTGSLDVTSVAVTRLDGADVTVADVLDDTYTDAYLVLQDGALVTEWYGPGGGPDQPHALMSVTKSLV